MAEKARILYIPSLEEWVNGWYRSPDGGASQAVVDPAMARHLLEFHRKKIAKRYEAYRLGLHRDDLGKGR